MNALRGLEISRGYRDRTPEAGRRAHLGGNDGASGSDAHPLREAHAVHRRRIPREPPRRPRDLDLRRARQGRHHASGLPQHGAHARASLRRAARPGAARHRSARETDTGNGGYTHKFFKAPRNAEEMVGARDAIAEWARVTYGWMGRSPDYKAAFLATLGANSDFYAPLHGERAALVQESARRRSPSSITRSSILRSIATSTLDEVKRRVHARREGNRRRPDCQRREGGGDDLHADALQLHRQQRRAADQDQGVRVRLHRADRRPGREAVLPAVV